MNNLKSNRHTAIHLKDLKENVLPNGKTPDVKENGMANGKTISSRA